MKFVIKRINDVESGDSNNEMWWNDVINLELC